MVAYHNSFSHPRLGLVVSKRNIKTAIGRNQFKRLVRETFRLNQYSLPNKDIVVIAKKSARELGSNEMFRLLNKLWLSLSPSYPS